MKRYSQALLLIVALITGWSGQVVGKISTVPIDELEPSQKHRQSALIITKVVERFHYKKVPLDDALSKSILDRYLASLDPNRNFFTAQDYEEFVRHQDSLDDALKRARLEPAFTLFKRFRQRVDERVERALALLKKGQFDFNRSEVYQFDRKDAPWAKDEAELDDLWRQRIKNDILSLRLSGKKESDIKETLTKRYTGISRRVRQFTADDVFQSFVNAYTLSIEPHTSYMSPRISENFDISMRLSLQGIGAVLRNDNEFTLVQSTVPGGPAERGGELHAGDRIIGVAQGVSGEMEDVVGWRLQDVVDLIRGPKGSLVRLNVVPKNEGADGPAKLVSIERDEIKLEDQAAKSEVITDLPGFEGIKIGVIEIPAFYRDFAAQAEGDKNFRSTTRDVRSLLADLQTKGVHGIVIDLRSNGGGSLSEATELTGLFIENGAVVQVKDASGRVDVERDPDPEQVYDGPLAVLVDRNSASASEIFAGAIQDYRRGIVIGEPTFGKGTVQTLVDLARFVRGEDDLGRLRLTMAQFFRIDGDSTQHRGVTPDIVFPTSKGAAEHGERSLDNAIPWAAIKPLDHPLLSTGSVASLRDRYLSRVDQDPGFRYLIEQEEELIAVRNRDTVSLLETDRMQERDTREKQRLERRNRLRVFRGLEPISSLERDGEEDEVEQKDDDPEGVERIMLEESARILADHVRMLRPRTALLD